MAHEYELVSHDRFSGLKVFVVRLQSRRPHIHRELELGLILEGELSLRQGRRCWELKRDDCYLVNSMEAHDFSAVGDGTLILAVQISPMVLEPFLKDAAQRRFCVDPPLSGFFPEGSEEGRELRASLLELAKRYLHPGEGSALFCYYLVAKLMLLLHQQLPSEVLSKRDYASMRRQTDRVVAITDCIDHRFRDKLLLEEIAEDHGLTMTYVSHLFKDALGISFQEYVKEKRFEHALFLLSSTDKSILDICMESGFSDLRYMTGMFRSKFGCTPKEYRKMHPKPVSSSSGGGENEQEFLSAEEAVALLQRP